MKDIVIICNFITLPVENGNSRPPYIADMLLDKGYSVEIITSSFHHGTKTHRNKADVAYSKLPYKLTIIDEPGYKKNVCLARLRSHSVFASGVKKYLLNRKKPDLIYCLVPSLNVAKVAANYCKKFGVKFIADIQDLWPEAFKIALNIPVVSNILFYPMGRTADKIYSAADEIIAVSKTYLQRGLRANKKGASGAVVYLGTDMYNFDACAQGTPDISGPADVNDLVERLKDKDGGTVYLAYAGTLGSSYDLPVVFEAMRSLEKSVLDKICFVVMGNGPREHEFRGMAAGLPVVFTGTLPYSQMVWIISRCDIAVCPIVKGAAQSIINKHMDYAMAGLPVINTQECEEYRSLISEYNCGINCICGDSVSVADAIVKLVSDADLRKSMGNNSRAMGEKLFDRKDAYARIVEIIEEHTGE